MNVKNYIISINNALSINNINNAKYKQCIYIKILKTVFQKNFFFKKIFFKILNILWKLFYKYGDLMRLYNNVFLNFLKNIKVKKSSPFVFEKANV